jgi:CheY-like chemotaxis protein/HPt (histidine-containing phosphotransfer) domain-containing protein
MRVLVAEDGVANQHVAVGMLHAGGHQAVVVGDGRETIARWQSEPFDLILMDMHMPVMDGIEATKQIRAAEQATGTHIPIIALTAAAMKEDEDACNAAGMDGYLPKPIHPRMLQEMLAQFAPETTTLMTADSQGATGASLQRQAGSAGSGERLADKLASNEPLGPEDTIDLRSAASRVPGGLQGVRRLAEVFLPECESLLATLHAEIPDGDQAVVQRMAHTLKGSANLFYAKKVYDAASVVERLARDQDPVAADQLLVLDQEVASMMRALKNFLDITAE